MIRFVNIVVLLLLLNSSYSQITEEGLKQAASRVVIHNAEKDFLPIADVSRWHAAVIHSGDEHALVFDSIANKYLNVDVFKIPAVNTDSLLFALHDQLKFYDLVIVRAGSNPLTPAISAFFGRLSLDTTRKLITVGDNLNLISCADLQSELNT
ncbi:MAG: hypothetical protein EOO02_08320, partial [Chitinophagaceae bacterium]